ncbi:type II toxin-antitoxin system VapC family toxin [Rhizobium rhizosphaerae]|uniref:type II toxin-antitoxin system VapC family toxin n=1 Tax=Xaviernesmea rhizosphaerae TaxID=1672749 RepID=UPI001FD97CDA|nr:PIN domain-containing protein [Xaviernesmea rhizosphaerae]
MPRYYWDACMWLALIKKEPGRFDACKYVIERAQRGEVEVWTSTFTMAEVYKRKCADIWTGLPDADDDAFADYIEQDFVIRVALDVAVGTTARNLLRLHPAIGKPQDAIHLATALIENVDELHTFDQRDLLGLSGKIQRLDGVKLKICHPPEPPDPDKGTLFEKISSEILQPTARRAIDLQSDQQ